MRWHQLQSLKIKRNGVLRPASPQVHVAEIAPAGREVWRQPQRGLVVPGRQGEIAALHVGMAEFGVQAGYHFGR